MQEIKFTFNDGLRAGENCIPYWGEISWIISHIHSKFQELFKENKLQNSYPIFLDNADGNFSGHAPIIIPMFGKVLLIKLRLNELKNIGRIYYQYAHEFTHAMFYCELGIDKKFADSEEEAICTAASLLFVNKYCPSQLEDCKKDALQCELYRGGVPLADEMEYDFEIFKRYFYEYCRQYRDKHRTAIAS